MDPSSDAVPDAAHGDDTRTGGGEQPVEQQSGECEVTEVVDAELQLEAVRRRATRRVHDARVVDQQVDLGVAHPPQVVGRLAHRLQCRQVQLADRDVSAGVVRRDP